MTAGFPIDQRDTLERGSLLENSNSKFVDDEKVLISPAGAVARRGLYRPPKRPPVRPPVRPIYSKKNKE
jgi:hypothetical protein